MPGGSSILQQAAKNRMSLRNIKIACAQLTSTNNSSDNFESIKNFNYVGLSSKDALDQSSYLDSDTIKKYQNLAKENGIHLSLGGFHERIDDKKMYNTHLFINNVGDIISKYRKIHLFDANVSEKSKFFESEFVTPGDEIVSVMVDDLLIGLTTCYDIRFPELYVELAKKGCNVILIPACFTVPTGNAHWEILLRSRAIETQCYVVAAAQVGRHHEKRESYGNSLIIDPWGKIIASCGEKTESLAIAEIDLNYLNEIRNKMPVQKHRKL